MPGEALREQQKHRTGDHRIGASSICLKTVSSVGVYAKTAKRRIEVRARSYGMSATML
jgi:hypothetical protein